MVDSSLQTPDPTSPLELLIDYLRRVFPAARVYRYSCHACFRNLWSHLDGESVSLCTHHHSPVETTSDQSDCDHPGTIVVFDGPPPSITRPETLPNLHFDSLFSPLVLYTLLMEKGPKVEPRWLLVDPHKLLDSTEVGIAQVFHPSIFVWDEVESHLPLQFSPPQLVDERKVKSARAQLKLLVREPATRHDLSNIVGPVLLGFEPTDPGAAWIIDRLCKLLEWIPSVRESRPKPLDLSQWTEENGSLEFILVDDQWRNGWVEVLCGMVGASPVPAARGSRPTIVGTGLGGKVVVSVSETAEFLVDALEEIEARDKRFELNPGSKASHQVLLLDLRLFSGRPISEEAALFSRLSKIARKWFCDRPDLPWPGYADEELNRLDSWISSASEGGSASRSDSEYLEALALLPRLIALSDMSLPILIFSSTRQRKITDEFHPYRNIIVDFSKPSLLGYDIQDLVAQTYAGLYTGVRRALGICRARSLCRNVVRLGKRADECYINRSSPPSLVHYELYVDESGSPAVEGDADVICDDQGRFIIGGLLVGYQHPLEPGPPAGLHAKMESNDPSLRWWSKPRSDGFLAKQGRRPGEPLPSGAVIMPPKEIIEEFLALVPQDSVRAVCMEYRDDGSPQPEDEVEAQNVSDNRFRRMLSLLLETVLFDLLPEMNPSRNATLSIFIATRRLPASSFRGNVATISRLIERYGYDGDSASENPYVQTIDEAAIVPILSEVKKRRQEDELPMKCEHVRGVVLYYPSDSRGDKGAPKWPGTRHQHYLADIVVGAARQMGPRIQSDPTWRKICRRGMYTAYNDTLTALLNARRALSRCEPPVALLYLQDLDWNREMTKTSIGWVIARRLRDSILKDLTGWDFITLASKLGPREVTRGLKDEGEIGTILHYSLDKECGFIRSGGRDCRFNRLDWRSATLPNPGLSVNFLRIPRPTSRFDGVEWVHSLS